MEMQDCEAQYTDPELNCEEKFEERRQTKESSGNTFVLAHSTPSVKRSGCHPGPDPRKLLAERPMDDRKFAMSAFAVAKRFLKQALHPAVQWTR